MNHRPSAFRVVPVRCRTLRWLAACGLGVIGASPVSAQQLGPQSPNPPQPFQYSSLLGTSAPQPTPSTLPTVPNSAGADCDRPAELPPLLSVPSAQPPQASNPSGPTGEYDHGYLYLPERAPDNSRDSTPPCGPAGRFWFSPTLELAWSKSSSVPSLVRVGSLNGPLAYGGDQISTPMQAGLGLNGGFWLDAEHTHGFDASLYYLSQGGNNTVFFSNGQALLLPTTNGVGFPLADPSAGYAGSYQAGLMSRFSSADTNYRQNVLCSANYRLDTLIGYRFGDLGETFEIYGKRLGPDGQIVRFRDDAKATNLFHGGQIGLSGEYRVDQWFISATTKIAFGTVFTSTDLSGKFRVNGNVITSGFYSRPGTEGEIDSTRFGVMPTVGLNFGRQLGKHGRVFIGYNLLYLSGVTRGTEVLSSSPNVQASNPQAVTPTSTTQRSMPASDFWVQSMSLGAEWRF